MMKKIVISSVIIAGLCSGALANDNITYYGVNNGTQKINSVNFSDVSNKGENYWAKSAIYQIASLGIMQGMSQSNFSPTTKVTNEQAITTILNSMGKADEVNNSKMATNYWSDKYIKYAMKNGLISEKTVLKLADVKGNAEAMKKKGVYIRDLAITREEIAMLITKAFKLPTTPTEEKKPVEFVDKNQIDESKKSYVDAVSQAGIMVGSDDGMFNPKSGLTRAELAQILKNCEGYTLANLGVTKRLGFVESASSNNILISDESGADIKINVTGLNIPTLRNNILTGVSALKSSDEIEYYVDTSKCVKFIRVIDASIYGAADEIEQDKKEKQGIVTGNSPYFYEISIKDKNGKIEKFNYGRWTEIYKDGKETSANDIMQGDTVYLEFDDLGDLVVIRGVTNSTITYATVTKVSGTSVSLISDSGNINTYELKNIPIYKNGEEISVRDLQNGEYAKVYSSQSKVIKVEIVLDERTVEGIYKGYISEINQVQDRIIIRNPKKLENGKWISYDSGFVTFPMDKDMQISYEGITLDKDELGEKQVGKFSYIATRKDTQVIEKIKSINIGTKESEEIIKGNVSSFNENSGLLKISGNSIKPYVDETTIVVMNNKIIPQPTFNKGDNLFAVVVEEDDEYIAKVITMLEEEEERAVYAYFGKVTAIDEGNEVSMTVSARFEDDEWITGKERNVSFNITSETRIFNENEPLNFDEFNEEYKGKDICVVAYGDDAVIITVTALTETPHIAIGSVSSVDTDKFTITDVEVYDLVEEEWIESIKEDVVTSINTAITKNGRYAKFTDIEKDQEVIIIKPDALSNASVVLLKD